MSNLLQIKEEVLSELWTKFFKSSNSKETEELKVIISKLEFSINMDKNMESFNSYVNGK